MPHFFISYAKKDTRELALQLNDALNALPNVTSWVDKSLKVGKSWELQIQKEIDRSDYMIVLYSPDINRHKNGEEESYVLTEIAYAKYTVHKTIIPVMTQKTDAPISLTMAHYIDFTLSSLRLDDLISAICDETGVGTAVLPSAAPKSTMPSVITSTDMMPFPFAWIDIPSKRYSIAKYPVTNAQFSRFIDAGGYNNRKWWTEAGWEAKQTNKDNKRLKLMETNNPWTQPKTWTDTEWNGAMQPVVGVSWHECVAFCLWLSDVIGEQIMLPTEDQWQYAAQGEDGRLYPWGDKWDGSRCNNNVDGLGTGITTPVTKYEGKGDSPFGVVDMSGNVLEWCLRILNNKIDTEHPVLRGGGIISNDTADLRCNARVWLSASSRGTATGFRIACSQ